MGSIQRPLIFYCGVFLTTLCTLVHQVITTRIFSVITWYHLAFLAISLAMLGMTAAGLSVYLRGRGDPSRGDDTRRMLISHACLLAVSLPVSHVLLLWISRLGEFELQATHVAMLAAAVIITAAPFYFSGVVVALALTRTPLPVGRVYGVDLLGAALGCLTAIGLLEWVDPSTACAMTGALAALAAVAFSLGTDGRLRAAPLVLVALLSVFSLANGAMYPNLVWVSRMNGTDVPPGLLFDHWNSHSRVIGTARRPQEPFFWGQGRSDSARRLPVVYSIGIQIDGAAFTAATRFEGDRRSLDWVRHDVTSLPYQLRGRGRVAVIGVGGGRDFLTALGFRASHVTGIEVNGTLVDLLNDRLQSYTGLVGRDDVTLIHDDGRSWMTRTDERFDLVQMSLIDTFAATSAGAMTLTENGLYTLEAWSMFLDRLRPAGLFSVSRYYHPGRVSETARALSLAVGTLLQRGAEDPASHIVLVASANVSTLLVGVDPLEPEDLERVLSSIEQEGFRSIAVPGQLPRDPILRRILAARSSADLEAATLHPIFQFAPSTDDQPFFFNMLKFAAWRELSAEQPNAGVVGGNLKATQTLIVLLVIVVCLIVVSIVGPLLIRGRGHGLPTRTFAAAASYFGLIGLGFMLIEVGLMQKFSILLGHPIHSVAVTLMSIILASGLGSLVSDRIATDATSAFRWLNLLAVVLVVFAAVASQAAIDMSISALLPYRVATVIAFTFPVAFVLGFFFPIGMRLLGEINPEAQSWMWGLNGALGVMGTLASVVIAMTLGIRACLLVGGACYLLLAIPLHVLGTGGRAGGT